jgi:hypothetical protein
VGAVYITNPLLSGFGTHEERYRIADKLTIGSLGKLFDYIGQDRLHPQEKATKLCAECASHLAFVRYSTQRMRTRAGQHYISLLALLVNLAGAMLGKLTFTRKKN